jgi:hypothetical protein
MSNLTERERLILETRLEVLEEVKLKVNDIYTGEIDEQYYLEEIRREADKIRAKLNPVKVVQPAPSVTLKPVFELRDLVNYNGRQHVVMEVDYNGNRYKLRSKHTIFDNEIVFVDWSDKNLKKWS